MERTFRIKEVNGNTSFQDKKLVVDKTKINLLIVLELGGNLQFNRVYNDIWKVVKLDSIADLEAINKLNAKYEYKNICLVHHGNIFSDTSKGKKNWAILFANKIREIKLVISKLSEIPKEINQAYVTKILEKSKLTFAKDGPDELKIKTFLGLKMLIGAILDSGTFISVACNEADDAGFLKELADFTDKNIKIFGNTNFSFIDDGRDSTYNNLTISEYHSILNSYLSSAWRDKNGWLYYDTNLKQIIITKKELWLHSMGKKIYTLVDREAKLTKKQTDKEHYAQLYFSKIYEIFHKKYVTTISYDNWKKEQEKKYPDFK
ncbi:MULTISPECIES: hypothetical protein [unclassified Flavobacterium]|uniref:hypothetical protein n=1 Tax=unclassified Flavobacterium TaxID=196869 RepID=UPI000F0C037D|nr:MULTISPECIES: hypothetical protein [unclassified Flavobacterium]AYN05793.1 hypothetical protein EAG11_17775 [Flavobacterium sp. 140616W15]MCD0475730.1 hypothetical protein [Flavobacterium sp. EDS]